MDEEEEEEEEEEDDASSGSILSAGLAWITILMNFVGLFAEFLMSGTSLFKTSSPSFTFFNLSLSRSFSNSNVPVETFLPTGDGDAFLRRA